MEILIIKTIILAYALTMTIAFISKLALFIANALNNRDAEISAGLVYKIAISWSLFYFFSLVN